MGKQKKQKLAEGYGYRKISQYFSKVTPSSENNADKKGGLQTDPNEDKQNDNETVQHAAVNEDIESEEEFLFSQETPPERDYKRLRKTKEVNPQSTDDDFSQDFSIEECRMFFEPAPADWLERVTKRLQENSVSNSGSFKELKEEWVFTGNYTDHGIAEEECELCDYYPVRYHFEIQNIHNLKTLDVGSTCIRQFKQHGLRARINGEIADEEESANFIEATVQTTIQAASKHASEVKKYFFR